MKNFLVILKFATIAMISIKFLGCNLYTTGKYENLTLYLPPWPPQQDDIDNTYPLLSRWQIEISTQNGHEVFYISAEENYLNYSVMLNEQTSFTARPITTNTYGQETYFFFPCGCIYPYHFNFSKAHSGSIQLAWEYGYLANLMHILYKSTDTNKDKLIQEFNWNKALQTTKENPCNPWLIDTSTILTHISNGSFKKNYLSPTNTISISVPLPLLSAYVPENEQIALTNQITILSTKDNFFYINPDFAYILTYSSTKKISEQIIFLPIFYEE